MAFFYKKMCENQLNLQSKFAYFKSFVTYGLMVINLICERVWVQIETELIDFNSGWVFFYNFNDSATISKRTYSNKRLKCHRLESLDLYLNAADLRIRMLWLIYPSLNTRQAIKLRNFNTNFILNDPHSRIISTDTFPFGGIFIA